MKTSSRLDTGEAHIWIARLDKPDIPSWLPLLSEDERARAARLRADAQRRFVLTRGLTRTLLARYLNVTPREVSFRCSRTGRPELSEALASGGIRFSIAHSADAGLIGIARGRAIGVDVERRRANLPILALADRFFTRAEATQLRALPQSKRRDGFFRMWIAKEALIKARGMTVPAALTRHELALHGDGSVSVQRVDGQPVETNDWTVEIHRVDPGAMAAVAMEGSDVVVRWRTLTRAPRRASA